MIRPEDKWYRSWFNTQDYLDLYRHRDTVDAKKIISLISGEISIPRGAKVLDLACGNGRHSMLFARKGFNVLGVDLSPFLIKQAKERLKKEYSKFKKNLKFEIRDMRNLSRRNEFDLVVNLFTSFGYFNDNAENEKVISNISRALKKQGYFLLDYLNRDHLVKNIVNYDVKKDGGKIIIQFRQIIDGIIEKVIFIILNDPESTRTVPVVKHYKERIKLYKLDDLNRMLKKNRLSIISVFGDYRGSTYHKTRSERLIILARKV